MKTPLLVGALLLAQLPATLHAAGTQDSSHAIVERGPHHRVWERIEYQATPWGVNVPRVHRYTELATGLHRLDEQGAWVDSSDEIEAVPGGAVARQGQTRVRFANNLATAGAIELLTPDGKRLRSHLLGISYFEPATGKNILIAQVKDCQGIINGNTVIYENAMTSSVTLPSPVASKLR